MNAACTICPHACSLAPGQTGACRARRNVKGTVIAENYGRVTSLALDPVEKKPLAHFHSGSLILSAGSYGCNLHCPFCQNASIADADADDIAWREISPEELAETAEKLRERGNIGVAYTYNEPLVGYEYMRDTARLVHEHGMVNVLVTNGYVNDGPLSELAPLVDAANIDLKGFTQDFYDFVGGVLDTVKHTIEVLASMPTCHVEVTTLIIPGKNDTDEQIDAAARWLASIDPEIPYHLTRFFPSHHLRCVSATPVADVYHLARVAKKHLKRVHVGNC